MITDQQIAQFKEQLLQEKARVEKDRDEYSSETTQTVTEESGDLSGTDPNNTGDEASNLFDRDRDNAAIENFDRLLTKIDRALTKIDEGTYGLSDVDGAPIPLERLEALPYAVATVDQEEAL